MDHNDRGAVSGHHGKMVERAGPGGEGDVDCYVLFFRG